MLRIRNDIQNKIGIIFLTNFVFLSLASTSFAATDAGTAPLSTPGEQSTTVIVPSTTACNTGYEPTKGGVYDPKTQTWSCKTGDAIFNCQGKQLCSSLAGVPSNSKITQQVHAYQTTYTLPCQPIAGGQCPSEQTPAGYIARLYQFGLMIVGLFAFGGIVYGALKYILSAGSLADQSDAREQITQAVLGLLLLLGSFLILYTINPAITNIQNPNLEVIQIKNIISAGEANNTGTPNQIATGGSNAGDPLCKLAVNAQIGVDANADLSGYNGSLLNSVFTGNNPSVANAPTPQLPNGTQSTGYQCISCKDNASRVGGTAGVGGTCACNSQYTESNGECISNCGVGSFEFSGGCISEAACLAKPGYSAVAGPKQDGVGNQCIKK